MGQIIAVALLMLIPCVVSPAKAPPVVRIALLDTGFNPGILKALPLCQQGHFDVTTGRPGVGPDYDGHGTMMGARIAFMAGDRNYCAVIIKVFGRRRDGKLMYKLSWFTEAIDRAIKAGAEIVNMSYGGNGYNRQERNRIALYSAKGVKFFVAAGNDNRRLREGCSRYPTCYPGVVVVGALDPDKPRHRQRNSNYGPVVDLWVPAHSTSEATAFAVGNYTLRVIRSRK